MWRDSTFLKECQELKSAGVSLLPEPGSRLARGFADLGFEEFLLLPGAKLLSLFTGNQSQAPADFENHFFVVPEADQLLRLLLERVEELRQLALIGEREWHLEALLPSGELFLMKDADYELLLIRALKALAVA